MEILPIEEARKRDYGSVQKALGGDIQAWEQIYAESYRMVLIYARCLSGSYYLEISDCEDLVSEAFLLCRAKLASYNGSSRFYGWVRGFVRNLFRNGRRKAERWIIKEFLASSWCRVEMRAVIGRLIEENILIISILDRDVETLSLPLFLRDIKYIRRENDSIEEIAGKVIPLFQ